jgi:2'-5' RNA ligase
MSVNQPSQHADPAAIFVSLEPDRELADLINGLKQQVRELAGDQLYLSHPPHLTVYLAVYSSVVRFSERWPAAFNEIAPVELELAGWRVFYSDAMTGRNTLVCEIAEQSKDRLRSLQHRVVAQLAAGRDRSLTATRYAARWGALADEHRQHVSTVGFPYIGAGWLPHFTIASIDPSVWPRVWNALEHHGPQGRFTCSRLQHYRLVDEHPVPLRIEDIV